MMNDGNDWIVDIDLEKFFDTVNHDKLMTLIGRTIRDTELLDTTEKNWEPVEISLMSNVLLKMIESGRKISINNADYIDACNTNGEDLQDIVEDLKYKRVIFIKDNIIEVLPETWLTVTFNGKYFFGDNFNSRMLEWYQSLLK